MSDPAPAHARQYPYEVVDGKVMGEPATVLHLRFACYRLLKTAEQIAGHSGDEKALVDVLNSLLALGRQLEDSFE